MHAISTWLNTGVVLVLAVVATSPAWCAEAVESGQDGMMLTFDGVTLELVRIAPETFLMGSEDGDSDERPVHEVRIGRMFYLGRTEVTVGQYNAFCKAQGYVADAEKDRWRNRRQREARLFRAWTEKGFTESEDHPAVCVRWHNAVAFCRWLSDRTGRCIRLPSEAEWEYACRAGTTSDYAGDINEMGWHGGNSGLRTHPVGAKRPNAWGLYDMHGNAWEWCQDNWHASYEGAPGKRYGVEQSGQPRSRRSRRRLVPQSLGLPQRLPVQGLSRLCQRQLRFSYRSRLPRRLLQRGFRGSARRVTRRCALA